MADTEGLLRTVAVRELLGATASQVEWARSAAKIEPLTIGRVRYYTHEEIEAMREMMEKDLPPEGWLTSAELAPLAGVSQEWLSALAKDKRVTASWHLHRWYFPKAVLQELRENLRPRRGGWAPVEERAVEEHPLDVPAVSEWKRYGFTVIADHRARCSHPLVTVGVGRFSGRLCGRCAVVYLPNAALLERLEEGA